MIKQLSQLNLVDQKVRDLAWAVFGPSLISQLPLDNPVPVLPEWHPELDKDNCDLLIRLDQKPLVLHHYLATLKSHFLGSYFEALWAFYLQDHPNTEIITKNHQIHDNGKTQGELDFVILNKKLQQHQHLELAVKFYLEVKTDENRIWMGPNKIDRLDKKLATLITKQLPFSDTLVAKKSLGKLGVQQTTSKVVLKGNLFRQITDLDRFITQLHGNPPSSNCGWLSDDQFDLLCARFSENHVWLPLPKNKWISPALVIDAGTKETSLLSLTRQLEPFRQRAMEEKRPFLVTCMSKTNNTYSEVFRIFVTPPEWPN